MNVQDFMRGIGKEPPALVYLFCPLKGAKTSTFEPFLAERAVQRFVDVYVDPSLKDLCYSVYYADEADPADIAVTAQTLPFLAERRIILIHSAEHYSAASVSPQLLAYLESPCESTVILLVGAQVDRRSKFYKACEKSGTIVECGELRAAEAAQWVRTEVEALGKKIEPGAVGQLLARAGARLGDVYNAVTVVSAYVGSAETIRAEDVTAACADVAEEEIWSLTDAIAVSDTGKALRSLRRIMDLGKDPAEIMGTINWLLKSAYAVAAGLGGASVHDFVAKKVTPLAKKLGVKKLRDAFRVCIQTELMLRSTGVNRALALELLVIKLAAPMPRKAAVSAESAH